MWHKKEFSIENRFDIRRITNWLNEIGATSMYVVPYGAWVVFAYVPSSPVAGDIIERGGDVAVDGSALSVVIGDSEQIPQGDS